MKRLLSLGVCSLVVMGSSFAASDGTATIAAEVEGREVGLVWPGAFGEGSWLRSVSLPATAYAEGGSFGAGANLRTVSVRPGGSGEPPVSVFRNGVLYSSDPGCGEWWVAYVAPTSSGSVTIPGELDGMPVRFVWPGAFGEGSWLRSLSLSANTYVEGSAFSGCANLRAVTVRPGEDVLSVLVGGVLYCRDVEMDDWWVAYVVPPEEGAIDPSLPPIGDDISVEDDYLSIEVGEMELDVDEDFEEMAENCISLESGSKVTLKVAGLPAGLKYDVKTGIVKGKTTKASAYWVTWTATNANGYKFTAMQKWVVGGVDVGDYDDIGISEYLDEVDFCTGLPLEEFCLNAGLKSVSGLPVGVKFQAGGKCSGDVCSACGDFISGMPTKVGKYTVTFIDSWRQKTVKTIVVRDGGSHYVNVKCGNGQNNRGAVTGTGVYSAGAKVKLTAKPAAGYYFAGWYLDEDCTEPYEGDSDYRTQNLTFVQSADEDGGAFYARFVSKAEDMSLEFVGGGLGSWNWDVDTESTQDSYWFEVTSETLPKVTAKGLPSGVKLAFVDGYYALQVTDVSKLKPGTSLVTLTAKNLSGATAQQVVRVVVPNIRNPFFEGLDYGDSAYSFRVGESFACRADLWLFDCPPGATISATGVPPGLRFVYDGNWGYASLMGMATKAGVYTVTLTAKYGALTAKATFTVEVKAFPTEAVGSYGGDIGYDFSEDDSEDGIGYGIYNVGGSFSLTVAKDGKISVKYPANGGMVSLSGYSCYVTEEEIYVYLSDAKGNWCDLLVYPGGGLGTYQVEGSFGDLWSEWSALGQRNVAKTDPQMKEMVTSLSKIGKIQGVVLGSDKIACPGCVYGYVSPSLTFTVGLDGMVKASGKINGRSVSGAALLQVLQTEDDYILYADFYDYKSTTGLLVYRAVFYWSLLRDYHPLGWSALCDGSYYSTRGAVACKPVIYLYPEEETVCGVKLELNGKLTCTYPDYALNGWLDFVAAPDGTLTFQDARQFYCLYWEGQMNTSWDFSRGYCVKGSETASFLSDVLLRMGLSFREANEFIIYWLPQMQDNPYNVISFQGENYMKAAKLQIEPQPESVLRVFMAWRPSRYLVSIPAPDIKPFERRGFTVVEWGGAKVCD